MSVGAYSVSVQIAVLLFSQHIRGSPFTADAVQSIGIVLVLCFLLFCFLLFGTVFLHNMCVAAIPPKTSFWMLPEGDKGKKGKKVQFVVIVCSLHGCVSHMCLDDRARKARRAKRAKKGKRARKRSSHWFLSLRCCI